MKKIFLFAAVAALFAACSSDDLAVKEQPQVQTEPGAVGFEAYLQKATTRAGYASADMDLTQLKKAESENGGFGVFGYYTDNHDYDQTALPNFMYNQGVFHSSSSWSYSPIMYWPNEYGYNAESDDFDKVTFFAYAPYVDVTPATGKLRSVADKADEWGIVGMTRNSNAGDPILKYIATFDNKTAVDLLWGVCNQADWTKIQAGDAQEFTIGKPWLDVQRPAGVDQNLKFTFKHATAKLTVKVDEFNDAYKATTDVDGNTRIWIRSVRFTGFTMKGALNLNNEEAGKPYWLNFSGLGDLVADGDVVVYDGRKDGKEGTNGGVATNEKVLGLADKFVETDACYDYTNTAWTATPKGVDKDATSLFKNNSSPATNDYFYVIPTDDDMEIEIIYDVETIDPNLYTTLSDGKTKGSHIENKISKKIKFGDNISKLEAGKAYVVNLHLGMNDVDFDADIVDWDDMVQPDIDLPANMPSYAVTTTPGKLDVPGADSKFYFAVTGLKGGESVSGTTTLTGASDVTVKISSKADFSAPDSKANASGVAYVEVNGFNANNTVLDLTTASAVTISPVSTGGSFVLNVTQKAQPLALAKSATTSDNITFQLASTRGTWATIKGTVSSYTTFKVWCDGALLTNVAAGDLNEESEVTVDIKAGTIKFNSARTADQIIKVTIEAGDVPEETVSFKGDGSSL